MSTMVLEQTTARDIDGPEDYEVHVVCCDEDTSLCGLDMHEIGWSPDNQPREDDCPWCLKEEALWDRIGMCCRMGVLRTVLP